MFWHWNMSVKFKGGVQAGERYSGCQQINGIENPRTAWAWESHRNTHTVLIGQRQKGALFWIVVFSRDRKQGHGWEWRSGRGYWSLRRRGSERGGSGSGLWILRAAEGPLGTSSHEFKHWWERSGVTGRTGGVWIQYWAFWPSGG